MVAMSTLVSVLFAISILKYLEATGESAPPSMMMMIVY